MLAAAAGLGALVRRRRFYNSSRRCPRYDKLAYDECRHFLSIPKIILISHFEKHKMSLDRNINVDMLEEHVSSKISIRDGNGAAKLT